MDKEPATKGDIKEAITGLRVELKGDISRLEESMDKLFTYMGTLHEKTMSKIELLAEHVYDIKQRQQKTEEKVDLLTETIGDIKVELTIINQKLDQKVDRKEFESRLRPLEARA